MLPLLASGIVVTVPTAFRVRVGLGTVTPVKFGLTSAAARVVLKVASATLVATLTICLLVASGRV